MRFGPKYDVTQPLVLTRIRQDVSAGKCVAGMISPPRQHTSGSPKVISASAAIANLLHRARMHWILEHPCDSWLWDVPQIEAHTAWTLADYFHFWLKQSTENGHCFWLEMWTAEIFTVLLAGAGLAGVAVFQVNSMVIQKFSALRSELCSSRDHTRAPKLSLALAMVLIMNAENTSFCGMGGYSLNGLKDIGVGVIDFAPICESDPVIDAGYTAVVGSACPCVLYARSDRETNLQTCATLATHDSHSLNN